MPKNFLFLFFRLQEHSNPTTLMDAKQQVRTPLLSRLFEPSGPYNHHTTQKICLHHYHYPNDHHHHHNSHHTRSTSSPW